MADLISTEMTSTKVLRVLVVDDQPILRDGLTALLELEDDIAIAGAATNGLEALELARSTPVDVVLMDVRMPVMDGIEATRNFVGQGGPPVVLLTTFEEVDDMTGGLNAGAHGYLFKSATIEEILHALKSAVRGEKVIHPRVAQHLARQMTRPEVPAISAVQARSATLPSANWRFCRAWPRDSPTSKLPVVSASAKAQSKCMSATS